MLDAVFIGIGIYDFVKDPSWSKGLWFAANIVLAVLPFIPEIGVIRDANKLDFADNGWDLVNGLNKTDEGFTISNRFIGTNPY